MRYIFILPFSNILPDPKCSEVLVGVDRGALIAIKNGLKLDYAIGDFDSVTKEELALIQENVKNLVKLNPEKDFTDTEYAINYFKDASSILVYGGIQGKRVDHLYANINLCLKYPQLEFLDNETKIMRIPENATLNDDYYYYSFFAKEDSIISLTGFKYDLDNYHFKKQDNLCISNEALSPNPIISFKGEGIMIMSKYDEDKE